MFGDLWQKGAIMKIIGRKREKDISRVNIRESFKILFWEMTCLKDKLHKIKNNYFLIKAGV